MEAQKTVEPNRNEKGITKLDKQKTQMSLKNLC